MYDIYLSDNIKTYSNTASFTGNHNIQVEQNRITIKSISRMSIKRGMVIACFGGNYEIEKITYNDTYGYYTLQVKGYPASGYFANTAWSIYNFTTTITSYKLDCYNVDITTIYSLAEIEDITLRKDTVTQAIALRGTEANNTAFGAVFHLNKHVNLSLANKMALNYTALRPVDCTLFENGLLVIKGSLVIQEVEVKENGAIVYQCNITGKLTELVKELGDAMLTDLDFKEYEHVYNEASIVNSWGGYNPSSTHSIGNSTYKVKDPVTGTVATKATAYGSGYFYPYIDYGEKFAGDNYNTTYSYFKAQNFRPALYLKEYLNKIFESVGYTYELKAAPDQIERFNRAFIPDASEGLTSVQLGVKGHLALTTSHGLIGISPIGNVGWNPVSYVDADEPRWVNPIILPTTVQSDLIELDNVLFPNVTPFGANTVPASQRSNNIIRVRKNFNSTCRVQVAGTFRNNVSFYQGQKFWVQVVKRKRQTEDDTTDDFSQWEILGSQEFTSGAIGFDMPFAADIILDYKQYSQSEQLQVRVLRKATNTGILCIITSASIKFSKDENTTYNVQTEYGDNIKPVAPSGIKQVDLITSVAKHHNFMIYAKPGNPKHFIFQNYDDFFAFNVGTNLKTTALNWTTKMARGFKRKSNITIPKKYTFTMKNDSDYLNDEYQKKYDEALGTLKFNDSYGFSAEKKVETIFSPTVIATIEGTSKIVPYIVADGITLATKTKTKSNIRILYNNGVHKCDPYTIGSDNWYGSFWGAYFWLYNIGYYPLCSNYYYKPDSDIFHTPVTNGSPTVPVPVFDIHWYGPKEYRFNVTPDYYKVLTAYDYYRSQTTELTNPDLFIIEANFVLNDNDVQSLDSLRKAIYIDTGEMGAAYFKVLTIEYHGNGKVSRVTLQRIVY